MTKAVFLDRDGTINIEKNYLHKIEDFEFLPGTIEALKILQDNGFLLVIVTNQSGIARGYYSEEQYQQLNNWLLNELKDYGVNIALSLYCPHHPSAIIPHYKVDCDCRKPKLGMYKKAVELLEIDLSSSFTIGDKIRDCALCEVTKCHGFLISNNEKNNIIDNVKNGQYKNVEYADSLLEAVRKIATL